VDIDDYRQIVRQYQVKRAVQISQVFGLKFARIIFIE